MQAGPQWQWHVDVVFVKIKGKRLYMWPAEDHEGEVLKAVVTKRRNKRATLRFLGELMLATGGEEGQDSPADGIGRRIAAGLVGRKKTWRFCNV